ncbi:M16 family metallopeptidase [Erythrobacter crassostreae]|uniref:Insulinase family protein n=1 Tax=Erythrobacter crassostreae TaxID=2828328 RepID=A0A9X1F5K4_9SPHN|nr:pitrilysin family protein [Erythrobacter crassostrea]MBV7259235.1 insulinase family protein [Erythrobacter crassostrea]
MSVLKTGTRLATTSFAAIALATVAPITPALADGHGDHAHGDMAKGGDLTDLVAQVGIPYEEFELENGLTVIVHEDRKAPVVGVAVWYNVGSKDEPTGKTGFAHLFEHLMFNGSENAPADYFQYLQEMGATDYNGTTNFDRTNYFQTVPRPALERALWLESDRMGYLLGAVTQEKLDNQRGVVQNEKRQGDNRPGGLVFYEILDKMFPEGHPYGHSVIGSMADLDSASMDDVRNWFRDKYGPNNATVVLAGDISAAEARPMMEKWFGPIARGPVNNPAQAEIPVLPEDIRSVMKDQVAATTITKYWPVPGITSDELTALNIGASVFGGLASSRLDEILVRDEQLAVGVSAGNFDFQRVGILSVSATLKPGGDLAELEARLDQLIAEYIAEGPNEDEVRRAATSQLAGTIRGLEQVGGFGGKAVTLARGEVLAGDPANYKKNFDVLAKLTPADVKAAMQNWMTRPSFTLVLEPGERDATYEEAASVETEEGAEEAAPADNTIAVSVERPAPPIGSLATLDFPDIERTTLANGMKMTYAQRDAVPATYVTMSFNAGSAADPSNMRGLEDLTMSLFDEGTADMSSQEIAEERERLGLTIGTGGGADRSTFTLSALSSNLTPSLELMSSIIREPAFAEADLERVRTQTITGIKQQLKSPQGIARRAIGPEIFGNDHPYGASSTVESVSSISRDDLFGFKDSWIRPDNGEVFVISDRPMAEVADALNAVFGDWSAPTAAKGTKSFASTGQATAGNRVILINRPNSPQSVIVGAQLTGLDASDANYIDFTNANNSLGGNFLARLNMNLRETKGWSYGVRGGPQAQENAVVYAISGGVQADKTGPSVAEMIRETSEFLTTSGVTPEELERNVAAEVGELPGRFETSPAVLGAMRSNALYNRSDDYYETLVEKYQSQTAGSLDAAAREALDVENFVWVVVGDASQVQGQLEELGLPLEVRELPTEE